MADHDRDDRRPASTVLSFPGPARTNDRREDPPGERLDAPPAERAGGRPATSHDRVPAAPERLWREIAGDVIRSERRAQHRTLAETAERAGISPQYLSEVERGRKEPSSEMLGSICGALGLTLDDLLAGGRRLIGTSLTRIGAPASGVRTFGGPTALALVG